MRWGHPDNFNCIESSYRCHLQSAALPNRVFPDLLHGHTHLNLLECF